MNSKFTVRLLGCIVFLIATLSAHAANQYVVTDLGTLGGSLSFGGGINASGQVTGFSSPSATSNYQAFLYSNGSMQNLGAPPGGSSMGFAINDSAQVTGNLVVGNAEHAFLYSGGAMQDLGTLGGTRSSGQGINASGQVVGWSGNGSNVDQAFLYSNGTMQDLGTLGGSQSLAYGINKNGQVTGGADTTGDAAYHAFLYSNGSMQDLGTLGGLSEGDAINASGQVTGISYLSGSTTAYDAFLYGNGAMHDLGTLGGAHSQGNAINDGGQVTGSSAISGSSLTHAFVYSNGSMEDLNKDIGSASSLYTLLNGVAINDAGQIVVDGYNPEGQEHALLLTPGVAPQVPLPASVWLLLSGLGLGAGLRGLAKSQRMTKMLPMAPAFGPAPAAV